MSFQSLKEMVRGRWTETVPALAVPLAAVAVVFSLGCTGSTGSCVAVYEFEGTVVKENYTQAECEQECATIGRTLQCFFEPRVTGLTAPGARRDG